MTTQFSCSISSLVIWSEKLSKAFTLAANGHQLSKLPSGVRLVHVFSAMEDECEKHTWVARASHLMTSERDTINVLELSCVMSGTHTGRHREASARYVFL
jgi:hypothetical protein